MSTIHQIKAARALLNWTQNDLADRAGLHVNAVNNAERGLSAPRGGTMEKMTLALEAGGVAFIGHRGVELRAHAVEVTKFEGKNFLRQLTDDILEALQGPGDDIISLIADIRAFDARDTAENARYYNEKTARGFTERMITADMPGFYPKNAEGFRVLPQHMLGPVDIFVYGDRTAFVVWSQNEAVVLKNRDLAFTQKMYLESLWEEGREPIRGHQAEVA